LSEQFDAAPPGATSDGKGRVRARLGGSTSPGNARPGDTITRVITVSETLHQRLPSARHKGADPIADRAVSAGPNPSRQARPDPRQLTQSGAIV
jgi:hypothetical protein